MPRRAFGGFWRNCQCTLAAEAWSRVTDQGVPPVMWQLPRVANWLWAKELLAGRWAEPGVTEAAWNGRGTVTYWRNEDFIKIRRLLVFFCCSIAQQQVKQERHEHSCKDRARKIWERSANRSPILDLVLKWKVVLMQPIYQESRCPCEKETGMTEGPLWQRRGSANPPALPGHSKPCFTPRAPNSFWKKLFLC